MTVEISSISLLDSQSSESVEASLWDSIQECQMADWERLWTPALQAGLERLQKAGQPKSNWPQSRHWDWRQKAESINGLLGKAGFSVMCEGVTQGLMVVDLVMHRSRLPGHRSKEIVYVEYVENAPWNRPELLLDTPRYKGVGTALMAAAILLSHQQGFKGRVGLHALPQSENWYAKICGMTDMGIDESMERLRYFEMTAEQANAFILKGN